MAIINNTVDAILTSIASICNGAPYLPPSLGGDDDDDDLY